jgi:hypothetical protein
MDWDEYTSQPSPRLFTTHLTKNMLPQRLVAKDGKGRLIILLRNLKDVLVSNHFFWGEPKDGWLGNEHGAGSLARFLDPDTPNAYGSMFQWVKDNHDATEMMADTGRVHVMYYEAMKEDMPRALDGLGRFLGVTLTDAKREALLRETSFQAMKKGQDSERDGKWLKGVMRKGEVGDWKNYLTAAEWSRFDAVFDERLGDVPLAMPLRKYQVATTPDDK